MIDSRRAEVEAREPHAFLPGETFKLDSKGRRIRACQVCGFIGRGGGHNRDGLEPEGGWVPQPHHPQCMSPKADHGCRDKNGAWLTPHPAATPSPDAGIDAAPLKPILLALLGTMRGIAQDRTVSSLENARLVARTAAERADAALAALPAGDAEDPPEHPDDKRMREEVRD